MKKYYIGWKQLAKAKNEEIVQVNFQAPAELRKKFVNICKNKLKETNVEIEFIKLMKKFINKHDKH